MHQAVEEFYPLYYRYLRGDACKVNQHTASYLAFAQSIASIVNFELSI
jgi:hypothetical protein